MTESNLIRRHREAAEELSSSFGPVEYLRRFASQFGRRRLDMDRSDVFCDISVILDGRPLWALIGGCPATSYRSTMDRLSLLSDVSWDECRWDFDAVCGDLVIEMPSAA